MMEFSLFVAKIIAITYLSFGIGVLLNPKYYKKVFQKLINNPSYLILGGFIAIIIGFIIVENHNIWTNDWTVIITVIGWAALIKGILLLAFPKFTGLFKNVFNNRLFIKILGPAAIILGLIFMYFGFFI